jgi:hypothetical protein
MRRRALQSETLFRPRAILPARVLAKFRGPSTGEGNDEQRKALSKKTGKVLGLMTNRCVGYWASTQRAPRSYGAVAVSPLFWKPGAGSFF